MIVSASLMGGLGNQMFQIAHAINVARNNDSIAVFSPKSYTPMQGLQTSYYQNNIFRFVNFVQTRATFLKLYESEIHYIKNLKDLVAKNNVEFFGYFQSETFFKEHSEFVKQIFSPPTEFVEETYNKFPFIIDNSLSLHIRRGDYLSISDTLPVLDKTYIDASLRKHGEYNKLLIFSDDPDWAESLNYKDSVVVRGQEDYEDLWTMSLCSNNIISNSSFSWWSSFLNKNTNKKIYVPSKWFGPAGLKNYLEIYRDDMIRIPVFYHEGKLIAQ